jgi:hypothetical protein
MKDMQMHLEKLRSDAAESGAAEEQASTILAGLHEAEAELVGKAVILTDGKAGTVERVWLDELHGLRISVRGHEGRWPVSTIKLAQTR